MSNVQASVVPLAADDTGQQAIDTSMEIEPSKNSALKIIQEEESNPIVSSDEASPVAVARVRPTSRIENDEEMDQADDKQETEEKTTTTSLIDVYQALDSLDSEGCAWTGGLATELPSMPGLIVEGVGEVKLPLDQDTATKLKTTSSNMLFQAAGDILEATDADVAQIDADKVTLTNPAWFAGLKALTKKVCAALGVDPELVRTELSSLLLNLEGDCSRKHRDLKKADGKFASLMIQLPSRFTGGSFAVTHDGNTKTFTMHDPETCPFSCRYVAHYADCEHEILPIESGHQLALVYSLCYTDDDCSKPSLANVHEGSLVSVIAKLDRNQSLFAIPIDKGYESLALARHGVNVLKGKDRSLARTIGRVEGWQLLIAKVEGSGSHRRDVGNISCKELFHQDGSDAQAHQTWLDNDLCLDSITKGGSLLAVGDRAKYVWNLQDSRDRYSYINRYSTSILIAFSENSVFERICRSDFSKALEELSRTPIHMDRALKFMAESTPILNSADFVTLHSLLKEKDSFWSSLNAMMQGLSNKSRRGMSTNRREVSKGEREVPSSTVISILTSLIKEHGWDDEKITPIRLFLEQLADIDRQTDCMEFLSVMEHFLTIKKVLQNKDIMDTLVEKTIDNFAKGTGTTDSSLRYSDIAPRNRGEIYKRLESMSQTHGYESISSAVQACFVRIQTMNKSETERLLPTLVEQIAAVESIHTNVPDAKLDTTLHESILDTFASFIKNDYGSRGISSSQEFPTIHSFLKNHASYWPSFNVILKRMHKTLPGSSLTSILASVIKEHGWDDEKMAPVRDFLETLPDRAEACNCFVFLNLLEPLLVLKRTLGDKAPIDSLIERTIKNFDMEEGRGRVSSKTRKEIYSLLEKRVKEHGWEILAAAVDSCVVRTHKLVPCDEEAWLEIYIEQIDWVKSLRANKRLETSIVDSFEGVVEENIVGSFEGVASNYCAHILTSSARFTSLHSYCKNNSSYWSSFEMILEDFVSESKPVPSNFISILVSTIQKSGWLDDKVAPIRQFLEQLANKGSKVNCIDFLTSIEPLVSIREALEDKSAIDSLIEKAIRSFETKTERESLREYYTNEDPEDIYRRIETLTEESKWESLSSTVKSCFSRIRKVNTRKSFLERLVDQIEAIESFSTNIPVVLDKDDLREPILTEFVSSLTSGRLWDASTSDIESMLEKLVMYGTTEMFDDVETWASTASSSWLSLLDSVFQNQPSISYNVSNREAVEECITYVHTRAHEQQVADLKEKESELVRLTQERPSPVTTWRIPEADTGDDDLDEYLHSDRSDSYEIHVGGGKDHARKLIGNGEIMSLRHAAEIGVKIETSRKIGQRASVIVKKAKKQEQRYQLEIYKYNLRKLVSVRNELEDLGHRPRPRPPADDDEPPSKRAKFGDIPEVIVVKVRRQDE